MRQETVQEILNLRTVHSQKILSVVINPKKVLGILSHSVMLCVAKCLMYFFQAGSGSD